MTVQYICLLVGSIKFRLTEFGVCISALRNSMTVRYILLFIGSIKFRSTEFSVRSSALDIRIFDFLFCL